MKSLVFGIILLLFAVLTIVWGQIGVRGWSWPVLTREEDGLSFWSIVIFNLLFGVACLIQGILDLGKA